MTYSEAMTAEPDRRRFGFLQLALFSVVFLMLAAALPDISFGHGNCIGTVASLEGPLLPVIA